MEAITISKEEYLSLLNVIVKSDKLIHALAEEKQDELDVSITLSETIASFGAWRRANESMPPTTNVFNGNN